MSNLESHFTAWSVPHLKINDFRPWIDLISVTFKYFAFPKTKMMTHSLEKTFISAHKNEAMYMLSLSQFEEYFTSKCLLFYYKCIKLNTCSKFAARFIIPKIQSM